MKRYRDAELSAGFAFWPIFVFGIATPFVFMFMGGGAIFSAMMEASQNGEGGYGAEERVLEAIGDPRLFAIKFQCANFVLAVGVLLFFNGIINKSKRDWERSRKKS